MLTVFDGSTGYPIANDDYYVRYLASGLDEVIFNVSIRDPVYKYLVEEAVIRERDNNYYLIKQIDAGSNDAKIVAQIDIDDWKSAMYIDYSNGSKTVYQTVLSVMPSGWTCIDYTLSNTRRTIPTSDTTSDYNVTAWKVLQDCCSVYGVRFRFNNVSKVVYIINPDAYESLGAFATRDLNLKELNFKGKSNDFYTRLYAEGADGMTFASINDNKAYIDDNSYSDKIISYYWKDERYTDKQSLLDDATEKLAELAKPVRSYDCDVLDLANTNPDMYGFENFELIQVITLIDDAQERRLDYQIVEKWEYPYYPVQNKVVLSTSTPKIQNQVTSLIDSVNSPTSTFQQIMQSAIANSTALITGNKGGYVVFHDSDNNGYPDEILIMNTPSIETATKVWRWNASGLGYSNTGYNGNYGLAMTIDGSIVANYITTGTLTANLIKAGILTDTKGKFSLNMETGALSTKDGTFSGTISASTISGGTISGSTISGNTIRGGTISGTTISGTTISGGTISGATISGNTISGGTITGTTVSGGTISGATISGNTISGGTINGTSISGTTITGGTIQTASSGSRIVIDGTTSNAPSLKLYGTSNNVLLEANSSGVTVTGGTISGSTISGGTIAGTTITGGTIQTATEDARIVIDGSSNSAPRLIVYNDLDEIMVQADENGLTVNEGTITGATIRNASSGAQIVMDSTSSLTGQYNGVIHNIINMEQNNSGTHHMIVDAEDRIDIRTPAVYVTDESAGTGSTTVYETFTDNDNGYTFVSNIEKDMEDRTELFLKGVTEEEADVYCTLPVVLTVTKTNFKVIHGRLLTGETEYSESID